MEYRNIIKLAGAPILAGVLLAGVAPLSGAWAGHSPEEQHGPSLPGQEAGPNDGSQDGSDLGGSLVRPNPNTGIEGQDDRRSLMSGDDDDDESGGFEDFFSELRIVSRGRRTEPDATTDVWALDGFAYTGTFNNPCGGTSDNAGVHVWRVREGRDSQLVTVILTPGGSRSNDVKVANMNSGRVLVHSNESCNGGPGGFEIYNVDNPRNPAQLASVRIDELNPISDFLFGGITDVGVHNLWLFTQGDKDYVAAVAESAFDTFRIYDISDPANPTLAGAWGAEEDFDPGVGDLTDLSDPAQFSRVLNAAIWLTNGVGASANRFLHDITINADATEAYLSNWDAGLILLDISDPSDPQHVSTAIDVANGSLDGEVNSHAAWPSEDGSIVVETEEDFSAWEGNIPPGNLTLDSNNVPGDPTIPGTAISTNAGGFFEANQTGLTGTVSGSQVSVAGGPDFDAIELSTAAASPTFADTGALTAELVFIGRACVGDPILNAGQVDAGDIAVVRRGNCDFEEKNNSAASLGAAAVVIANNQASTPWGGVRIWDYTDPANPVLASLFDTFCSASTEPSEQCDDVGTYSVHNVIVETEGEGDDDDDDGDRRVKAYIAWYWDGVLILDVTDPYNPIEIARFSDTSAPFEAQNGGHQDHWGIYKIPGRDEIYTSDRNGGLYVFEEEELDDDDGFSIALGGDDDD